MAANTPQNYQTLGQAPLDAKLVIVNKEILDDIIAANPISYAFNFYKGMKVYLQEEEKLYIWEYVFSESYKENDKLLSQDYIYPQGTIYEGLDYSGKAYNLIEIPARKENIGVWDIDGEELIVEVVIYENSSTNPFVVGDILNLWPNTERIAFIGGNITGLKLSGQPVQLYDEFFISDWNNLSYDIQTPGSDYTQTARMKLIMPGEIVDYTQYMDILGNSFKAARIVHDELEMEHKSSIYFKPNGTTFEIHVVDKLGVKRSFIGGNSEPGPKGDKPAHEWNNKSLRFENPDGQWGSYVNLQGENGESSTIEVGSVVSLNSDENPVIDNVGTSKDAIFNFGIPKGENGKTPIITFEIDDNMHLIVEIVIPD